MNHTNKISNNIKLTRREIEVVKLLIEGFENEGIADKINISTHTVKAHISGIMKKLDAKNRTEAACKALKLQLL